MREAYETKIKELRRHIETGGARATVIDSAIEQLTANAGESLPKDLLLLLSDRAESDEGMFSIIHAAESRDDDVYVRALLTAFPDLINSAPRWASIILMRVLNNVSAQSEMVRQLHDADVRIKTAVREMCLRISNENPQFLSKTAVVILASS